MTQTAKCFRECENSSAPLPFSSTSSLAICPPGSRRIQAPSRCLTLVLTLLGLGLLLTSCTRDTGQRIATDRTAREGYSLGYQAGQNLKNQQVTIDLDTYIAGIRDALEANAAQMTPKEMRVTLSELAKQIQANAQAEAAAMAEKNLEESAAFLSKNEEREGIQVRPSGLQYKVLKEGTGKKPAATDSVTVNYRGNFIDGSEFASSFKQEKPMTAPLDRTIPGWKEGLTLMREGARYQFFIPPDLAYGERGSRGIEPNQALIFDVELISVSSGSQEEAPKPVAAHSGGR